MATVRKTNIFPIFLVILLVAFIGLKVVAVFTPIQLPLSPFTPQILSEKAPILAPDPNSIRVIAQANPNPVSVTNDAKPVPAICANNGAGGAPVVKPPAPADNESKAVANCATQDLNIATYVTPSCTGEACKVSATSVTLTQGYYGNVTNYVEELGFDGKGTVFKQHLNNIHFMYRLDTTKNYITLLQDTIWGGGPDGGFFMCDDRSLGQAFYRAYDQEDNNSSGGKVYPITASCNTPNSSSTQLKAFPKVFQGKDINTADTNYQLAADEIIGGNVCQVAGQTHNSGSPIYSTTENKMIFNGRAKCNGVAYDMAAFLVTNGSGKGEVSMYCKDKGLCGWYQKLDFSVAENQPNSWQSPAGTPDAQLKDVCQLRKAGGDINTLPDYFEYNIDRCENTPQTVLNNFIDEYSVTCLPKTDYSLDLLRKNDCSKVTAGKKCSNWNTTGELKFVAGNNLFGLFRNEELVKKRYTTTDSFSKKDRTESIEAYFTARSGERSGFDSLALSEGRITDVSQLNPFQSPLFKGSTLLQQCQLIYDKLEAVTELCEPVNRISGEENAECAINQYLPNTSLRYSDIYKEIQKRGGRSSCESLMTPNKSNTEAQALRDQILKVDPSMEIGYRPAFIVLATLVDDPTAKNPQLRAGGHPNEPLPNLQQFWQVDYLEIKVPTFGSDFLNRNLTKEASNTNRPGGSYQDPLRFTADRLVSLEIQEKYREEEAGERNVIRKAAAQPQATGEVPRGEIIGKEAPIKCRTGKGTYTTECDNIARALITFINASNEVKPDDSKLLYQFTPEKNWITSVNKCEVDEKNMYDTVVNNSTDGTLEEKDRQAEEAQTIGSKLEARNVGNLQKKTDAAAEIDAYMENIELTGGERTAEAENAGLDFTRRGNLGTTRVFMVSPHKYTLLYAQNAFMAMLSLEQQEYMMESGNFNTVLKTEGVDTFTSENEPDAKAEYFPNVVVTPTPGVTPSPVGQGIEVSAKLQKDNSKESPLLWQAAGSVANIPTRMLAMITTPLGSKMNDFTRGCVGPNATEMWLKGNCVPVSEDKDGDGKSDVDGTSTGASTTCVNVTMNAAQAQLVAAKLKRSLPGQQTQTPSFAGWAKYYSVAHRPQDQHLFQKSCPGGTLCIDYIADRIAAETNINPYLVMAISLNESGGLISTEPDHAGPHFGCGIGGRKIAGATISIDTIENKLDCVIGFFAQNSSLTDDAALRRYGYANGYRNRNLNKIISIISHGEYKGVCEGESPVPPAMP